jgi:hypothetical protein
MNDIEISWIYPGWCVSVALFGMKMSKGVRNFSQAQIMRSLMMAIKPKHVGAVLMQILIFFKATPCVSVGK